MPALTPVQHAEAGYKCSAMLLGDSCAPAHGVICLDQPSAAEPNRFVLDLDRRGRRTPSQMRLAVAIALALACPSAAMAGGDPPQLAACGNTVWMAGASTLGSLALGP